MTHNSQLTQFPSNSVIFFVTCLMLICSFYSCFPLYHGIFRSGPDQMANFIYCLRVNFLYIIWVSIKNPYSHWYCDIIVRVEIRTTEREREWMKKSARHWIEIVEKHRWKAEVFQQISIHFHHIWFKWVYVSSNFRIQRSISVVSMPNNASTNKTSCS